MRSRVVCRSSNTINRGRSCRKKHPTTHKKEGAVLVALRGSLTTRKEQLADIWSTGSYDYIWIDGQPALSTVEHLVNYCRVAEELGIDVQLRIPTPGMPSWWVVISTLDPPPFWCPK